MPRNPFRSEADAYRFLNAIVGYFAAIGVASLLGGRPAGLAVFLGLSLTRRARPRQPGFAMWKWCACGGRGSAGVERLPRFRPTDAEGLGLDLARSMDSTPNYSFGEHREAPANRHLLAKIQVHSGAC